MNITRQQPIATLQRRNEWVTGPKDILQTLKEYIGELYESPKGNYEKIDIMEEERVEKKAFTKENNIETITHLKSKAAGDASGLDNKCLKALTEEVIEKIANALMDIGKHDSTIPKEWHGSRASFLFKTRRPVHAGKLQNVKHITDLNKVCERSSS